MDFRQAEGQRSPINMHHVHLFASDIDKSLEFEWVQVNPAATIAHPASNPSPVEPFPVETAKLISPTIWTT